MRDIGIHSDHIEKPYIFFHEMFHAHHFYIHMQGSNFSDRFSNLMFGVPINELTKEVFEDALKDVNLYDFGFFTKYSWEGVSREDFLDEGKFEGIISEEEFEMGGVVLDCNGIPMIYVPYENFDSVTAQRAIQSHFQYLPSKLKSEIDRISIHPNINEFEGYFLCPGIVDFAKETRYIFEDVPESATRFLMASLYPKRYPNSLTSLKINDKKRRKLELLLEFDFLKSQTGDRLHSLIS